MKTIDLVRGAMHMADKVTARLADDMRDAPLTTPSDDAAAYPAYEEVLGTYRDLRKKNLARLEAIGEAGLDEAPAAVPPGFEDEMLTVGQTYLTIAMHQ